MDEKELKLLWESLSKDFDIGEFDYFKSKMSDKSGRKKFYDAFSSDPEGANTLKTINPKFSDFSQFDVFVGGLKKKEPAVSGQPSVVSGSTSPSESQFQLPSVDPTKEPEDNLYDLNQAVTKEADNVYAQSQAKIQSLNKDYEDYVSQLNQQLKEGVIDNFTAQGLLGHKKKRVEKEMEAANAAYQQAIEQLNGKRQEERKKILNPKNRKTSIEVGVTSSEGENAALLNEIYDLTKELEGLEDGSKDKERISQALKQKKTQLSGRLGIAEEGLEPAIAGQIYSNTIGKAPNPQEIREYEVGIKEAPVNTSSTQQRRKSGQLFYENLYDYYQKNPKAASRAFSDTFMDLPDETGARKPSQYDFEMVDFMIKNGKEAVRDEQGVLYVPEGAKDVDVKALQSQYVRNLKGLSQQTTENFIKLTPSSDDRARLESGAMSQEAFDKKYNYENITKNLQKQLDLVNQYVLDDKDKSQISDYVKKSYTYIADVTGRFGGKEYREKNPLYAGLNDYQKIYLEGLRISDPEKYENRLRLLTTPPELVKQETGTWNPELQMGYEKMMKEAEDDGIQLSELDYLSRIENLASQDKRGELDAEGKLELTELLSQYDELQKFKNSQIDRYPVAAKQEIIDNIGRATGDTELGLGGRFVYGVGSGIATGIDWLYETVTSPFSDKDSRISDLETIGNEDLYQSKMNKGWEDEGVIEGLYKYAIDPEFKKQVDAIDADAKLNQQQKYDAKVVAFEKYRKDKGESPIVITKNPDAGDINLSAIALLNTTSDVTQQILSQIALSAATGGMGNVSKIRSLATLFGTTFATTIDRYEAEALKEGRTNATSYAIRKATIDALTELYGDDLMQVKNLFKGKGAVGKIINSVTDAEWKAVLNARKGIFNKVKNVVGQLPKRVLKPAATESFEEGLAQILNQAFDGKDLFDGMKETLVTTAVGTIGTFALGLPFAFRSINNSQKVKLYNAGVNADKYIASVKSQLESGQIDAKEAQKRELVINDIKGIVDNMAKVDENGKPLSDQNLIDLAFNKYVELQAQKAKKENPKSTKLDQVIDELQDENAQILSGEVAPEVPELTLTEQLSKRMAEIESEEKGVIGEVAPEVPVAEKVEQLRAAEQAEYAAMSDPNDEVKRKEIYDKYDKLITPLLEKEKEVPAAAPVPSVIKVKSPKEVKQGDTVVWRGEDFMVEEVNAKGGFNLRNVKDRTNTVTDARITDEEFQGKRGEVAAAPKVEKFGVGFAPFREKNVFTEEEDVDIRTSPDYQLHQENVQKVAKGLGIKINNKLDTWGGYVDSETGNPVQEVSNIMEIEATPEQARVMAAILGKAAPEMQDSVLLGNYNEQGSGLEHIVKTGSFANAKEAIKLLKDNGLQYFSVDKNSGDVIILDLDATDTPKIVNLVKQLNENGIPAKHKYGKVNAEFIGSGDYDGIIEAERGRIGAETGFDIDAFVQEASGKYDAIKAAAKPVVPGKITSDALASELLDILGTPEVVAGEVAPAEVFTKDNLDDISKEGLNDIQSKVVDDVKNVVKSISRLVENTTGNELKVTIHKDQDTYGDAVINAGGTKQDSSTKGFYLDADGTIHLNMARVTSETMLHEGFHPVLDFIAKNNPEVIDAFYAQLGKLDGGRAIINDAIEAYRGSDETTIKKEAITDFVAKVADGSFELNQSNFEKVKAFILDLIKKLGFDLTTDVKDINDVKELAKFISDKFSSGKEIMSKEFIPVKNNGEPGEVSGAGRLDAREISKAKVPGKNPLKFSREKFKEVGLVSLPEVSLEEKAKQFNNKAIAINSDPTRVGELTLPSGKKIFMYGGLNYTALEPNVKGEIGFASTTLSKPKQVSGFIKSLFPETDGVGLVLTTSQKPESMLGNAYSLEYTLDAISKLPSKILRSSEFRREFFGKDIVAVREAFGEKEYNEFVKKYGRADLGSPEVIEAMVEELLTDIGNNFIARNSLVSNMLAGVVEKSTRAATKGEKGFVSVTPNKFIAKVLFDNFGLNQEKLFNEIGERGIVDAYMNEGKWGFITGGFESDSKVDYMSIQDKGVIHPQFNAKFHGRNAFLLDGAYMIDKLFKPELLEKNKKGELYIDSKTGLPKPYEKKASLMVAGSMYPKGVIEVAAREFAKPIPQFSRPIELDVVEGFYSPIQKRILEFKQPKASATKWKEIVGAKSDEAVFSGLSDWLNSQKPDAQLSKQDVLNFMKDNRIEIKEVEKSTKLTKSDAENLGFKIENQDGKWVAEPPKNRGYQFVSLENNTLDGLLDNISEWGIEGRNDTKYSQYQLPGGENYKEVLITLPTVSAKKVESLNAELDKLMGIPSDKRTAEETKRMNSLLDALSDTNKKTFTSSHFDEPNIIIHLRMNTRTDADGKKVLFLEEVQSDWGQKGKREGFKKGKAEIEKEYASADKKLDDLNKKFDAKYGENFSPDMLTPEEYSEYSVAATSRARIGSQLESGRFEGVSPAPFVTNTNAWVKLGLKYALKEAVRQGADRISWTTGEQQNERYDLSKQVREILYNKKSDNTYNVTVTGLDGREIYGTENATLSEIEANLGKDVAVKMTESVGDEVIGNVKRLKGENLKVGGKGMKAFYGDAKNPGIVANVAKALVKELTGKEGGLVESNVSIAPPIASQQFKVEFDAEQPLGRTWLVTDNEGSVRARETNRSDAMSAMRELTNKAKEAARKGESTQPAIEITPELRQSVQGGMPQFSRDNQLLKIKDFVQAQRNKGVSDDVIREALDKVAGKIGLTKQEIDNLMAGELPTKPKEYAVQEQAAGKVPVQPKARVSEEVEGGVPTTRPEEAPEEGKVEGEEGEVTRKPSGIKKGLVSQEILAKMNLEKVGDKELLESGRKIIDSGEVNPPSLVNKILDEGKGVLTPAEVVALITYKADLDNKQEDLAKEIGRREASGEDLGTLLADMKTLQTEIDNFDMAAVITAQQQSMSFRLRRYLLDRSYNITVQIEKYKRANNGVIPAEVEKKFREMDAQIKELNKKLKEAESAKYDQEGQAAMENIIEDVQREQANGPVLYTEAELEEKIQKGVQAEIEKIYSAMPTPKRSAAQRAINALENIQKKLRSKTYDASLGIPVAFIDAGITAIKNAIKLGIEVEKAVEIGIKTIKDKLQGRAWAKEGDFRKDMIDGFKAEGVSIKAKKTEPKINDDGTVTIPNQLIRDLVAQGITDIDDLADAVRKIVEPKLPGVTNRQVRDYITKYGKEVNPTRDDLTIKINTAKRIGRLLSRLEDMQKMGAAAYMIKYMTQKPSGIKLTQKEQELKKLIKQLEKDAIGGDEVLKKIQEQKELDAAKAAIRRRIDELSGKIARKDFSKKSKKQVPADQELRELQSEKEKVKEQFDNAQYEAEQKNKSLGRKINDALNELIVGLARTLVTGFDFGVVFTQGVMKVFTNPIMSAKAFAEGMSQFASESRQKKFENDLRASGAYELIKNAGLAVSVGDERASVQEQIFIANYVNLLWNGLATIVTFNHKPSKEFVKALNPFKASQRFMDAYLNYIRINTFLDISSSISKDGYPPEVDPDLHKAAAEWVNTTTMKGAKNIPKGLGFLMFSASKVASELKLFSPLAFVYYAQMPGPIRKRAILNFGKFALSFLAVTSLMRAALGDDEDDDFWDITSSNFLTFKFGEQRISFAGGIRPMLVFWGRFFTGRYVDQYGEVSKLGERPGKDVNTKADLVFKFFTAKFAPVPAAVWSKLDERAGREVEDDVLISKLVLPMWLQDSGELYENNPREIGALYTMLSLIGANVRTVESPFKKEQKVSKNITYTDDYSRKRKIELNEEQHKEYQRLFDEIYAKNIEAIKQSSSYKNKKGEEKLVFEAAFSKKAKTDAESDAQKLLEKKYKNDFKKFDIIRETPEEKEVNRILNRGER